MMNDDIIALYHSQEPICAEGRVFLADRRLSIPMAVRMGVCSKDGVLYFVYTRNGEPVRWKARSMADKKKQWMNKMQDEDKMSFKMPFFSHFKAPSCPYLIITEGEFDSIALSQLGACNCVSLPNGSGSVETAFRENYEFLQQFETIYIAFDMDGPGEEAAKKAIAMISPSKYRRICFPCKDANEWIQEHDPTLEDLEALMTNAKKVFSPNITSLMQLPEGYYGEVDLGISSGWKKLDEVLGGVRIGEVTVVTADTGAGKSTFCLSLFKNLADQGQAVWINSYEMDPRIVNRKIASQVLNKKMKFQAFSSEDKQSYKDWMSQRNVFINTSNDKVNIQILRDQFEKAALAYGVKYILIDHLDYIHGADKKDSKETKLDRIEEAVQQLHVLAMEFKVGIFLVVHPKQVPEGKEITMFDLKGSSAIKQFADNVIVISRMDRVDANDLLRVKIRVWKNRLYGREHFFYFRYLYEIDGYTESY